MYYSWAVIILFTVGLWKSAFSTYLFRQKQSSGYVLWKSVFQNFTNATGRHLCGSLFITHSAWQHFEKLLFKKNRKDNFNFKRLYLKSWYKFRLKTNIIRKFLQFSLKQIGFLHALSPWVHGRRLRPLQPPVPLPAARRTERVNAEPVKVLNLLCFVYFIRKWGET